MTADSLIRNWWMVAVRGFLAVVFGVTVYVWPDLTLSTLVVIFGFYAIGDGVWSIATGVYASERVIDAWPIWLEGVVSVSLGVLALPSLLPVRDLVGAGSLGRCDRRARVDHRG